MQLLLKKVFSGNSLDHDEARQVMDAMMRGEALPEQVGAFLGYLRARGESPQEVSGLVASMREHATPICLQRTDLIDTCGTGGDGLDSFNVSTTCAFIVAAAGLGVVKHGNRSISSKCGSADVLEELGVPVDMDPEDLGATVDRIGFGFLFARKLHPSMKNVAQIRQNLGVRTVFNLLGPLTNPAGAKRQVIGVYDKNMMRTFAEVLGHLGSEEVMIVHGQDGMDEVSLCAPTHVVHLRKKSGVQQIEEYLLDPRDYGFRLCTHGELSGGDAVENARILRGILDGSELGPRRQIVELNSACSLMVGGKSTDLNEAIDRVREILDSGQALQVLQQAIDSGRKNVQVAGN